jgi:hypothetical protein
VHLDLICCVTMGIQPGSAVPSDKSLPAARLDLLSSSDRTSRTQAAKANLLIASIGRTIRQLKIPLVLGYWRGIPGSDFDRLCLDVITCIHTLRQRHYKDLAICKCSGQLASVKIGPGSTKGRLRSSDAVEE